MSGNIMEKGIRFYKRYGIRGGIATLTGKCQIKDKDYEKWYEKHRATEEELKNQREHEFCYSPLISILTPVYNTPSKFLKEMIESVKSQTYINWQLCIANANPNNKEVKRMLSIYSQGDERIKVIEVPENYGIAQNTNRALEISEGDYIGLLDHDDILAPNALYEVVNALNTKNQPQVIYTDEDKITIDGKKHFQPNFKPEFNLDMLRSNNYICHFFVVEKQIVDQIGGFHSEYNGAQDHDFIFRCTEKTDNIIRIPKVLYHWRMHDASTAKNPASKNYAFEAGKRAIEDHLKRCGEQATVEMTEYPGFFKIVYKLERKPRLSVIMIQNRKIPIKMIKKMTNNYKNTQITFIIITKNKIKEINIEGVSIKVFKWEKNYNYNAMINFGAKQSTDDYLLFLSTSIVEISDNYLEELISNIMRREVGVVGGKIYYTNGKIKSAGIIKKQNNCIEEPFKGLPKTCMGYMNRQSMQQDIEAVVSENMILKKSVWEMVKGFDESSGGIISDWNFCNEVRKKKMRVIFNPYAECKSSYKNNREV